MSGGQEPPLLNAERHDPTPIRGRSRDSGGWKPPEPSGWKPDPHCSGTGEQDAALFSDLEGMGSN